MVGNVLPGHCSTLIMNRRLARGSCTIKIGFWIIQHVALSGFSHVTSAPNIK